MIERIGRAERPRRRRILTRESKNRRERGAKLELYSEMDKPINSVALN